MGVQQSSGLGVRQLLEQGGAAGQLFGAGRGCRAACWSREGLPGSCFGAGRGCSRRTDATDHEWRLAAFGRKVLERDLQRRGDRSHLPY
eukprot:63309-Prymnesium_polylepis.1